MRKTSPAAQTRPPLLEGGDFGSWIHAPKIPSFEEGWPRLRGRGGLSLTPFIWQPEGGI